MNILTGISIGAKIGCGIGASRIAAQACKAFMPEATNIGMKICQGMGVFAISGVAANMASNYIDGLVSSVEAVIETVKKTKKNEETVVEE